METVMHPRRGPLLGLMLFFLLVVSTAEGVEFINKAFTGDRQTTFTSVFQRYAKLRSDKGEVHAKYSPTAAALGFHSTHGMLEAGFALSYEWGNRKYSGEGYSYRVESDIPGLTVFSGVNAPFGLYVEQSTYLGYGTFEGKNYYSASTGRLGNSRDEHKFLFATSLEVGWTFELPLNLSLSPHAGLEYSRSPSETQNWGKNGGPRIYHHSRHSLDASAGLALGATITLGGMKIIPSVDATIIDSIGKRDGVNFHPGFVYRTAKEWRVAGAGGEHIGGRLRAGVDIELWERSRLGVDYSHERRKGYNDHSVSAMLGWSF